ncbi:MAG: MFS transporter [archaeon]|nr:MFS transporter [archaeon]
MIGNDGSIDVPLQSNERTSLLGSERIGEEEQDGNVEEGEHEEPVWVAPPVSLLRQAAFGSIRFTTLVPSMQSYFLNFFLLESVNMNPFLVGTLLWVKQLWDALTDPIVGALSDATVSPFGRRRPWVWLAVMPFALLWMMQWVNVPGLEGQGGKFGYYFVVLMLFSTASTCVIVPIVSLLPDMATSQASQLKSAMMLEAFGGAASMISSFVTAQLIVVYKTPSGEPDYQKGFLLAAGVFAPFLLACPLISLHSAIERPTPRSDSPFTSLVSSRDRSSTSDSSTSTSDTSPASSCCHDRCSISCRWGGYLWRFLAQFFSSLWQALRFWPFLLLVFIAFAVQIAVLCFISNWVLFAKYVLKAQYSSQFLLLTSQGSILAGFFFWTWMSSYLGKKLTFYLGVLGFSLGEVFLFLYTFSPDIGTPQQELTPLYLIMAFRGVFLSTTYIVPMALLPEVTALYEQHCIAVEKRVGVTRSKRSEGLLYSVFLLAQKTAQALIMAVAGYILAAAGYENPVDQTPEQQIDDYQPPSVILALQLMVCVAPLPILIISTVSLHFIPSLPISQTPFIRWCSSLYHRLRRT